MNAWAQGEGQPGLGYIFWREGEEGGAGPLAKNIGPERTKQIADQLGLGVGDAVLLRRRQAEGVREVRRARRAPRSARSSSLIAKDRFEFCWIVDFPMFEWNEEEKKIDFSHNPFSMPNMDGRTNSWRSIRTTTTRSSASRRSSTTSSATASSCRPARSAIIART